MRQDSGQFNKPRVILKKTEANFEKLCMTKIIEIFAAPIIYLNYTVDDLLKTVELKNI